MTKTLEMVFRNETGKSVTISLLEPKEGLTMDEVKTVMQNVISKNVFSSKTGDLKEVVEARILKRDSAVLA